jgi:hypothetical protein
MAVGDSKNLYTVVTIPANSTLNYDIAASSGTVEFVDRVILTTNPESFRGQFYLYAVRVGQADCILDESLTGPFKIDYSCRLYITDINTFHLWFHGYNYESYGVDVYINVRKIQIK